MTLLVVRSKYFTPGAAMMLRLQEAAGKLQVVCAERDAVTPEMAENAEIILGMVPAELLCRAQRLKWLHTTNAGIEPYGDLRLYASKDVILTNASGVYGPQIAEHGVGMLLALCRRFPYYVNMARRREWNRREDVLEVGGATAAVFGLGDLGGNLAKRLKALECTVLGVRNNVLEKPSGVDEVFAPHQKLAVLKRAQFVFSCLPQTPQTDRVFDAESFAAMPSGGIFINLGRGNCVDEPALYRALTRGTLFGAGLDVSDPEPMKPENPLWTCENILITAHSSAASAHVNRRSIDLFLAQLQRYQGGKRLLNTVDFFRGY
jgi:phosphoglycerate dehydrogenase-like enzyme